MQRTGLSCSEIFVISNFWSGNTLDKNIINTYQSIFLKYFYLFFKIKNRRMNTITQRKNAENSRGTTVDI